ncbi:hypothetical protein ABK040_001758 [Willaertia magna]
MPRKERSNNTGVEAKTKQKIVVLGAGGVGKSAIILQFIQSVFMEIYDPTLEDSYKKEVSVDGVPLTLDILDTAGQEELTSLRDSYVKNGEGFLLVYSITSEQSFHEIHEILDQIIRAKDLPIEEGEEYKLGATLPIVVVGNKIDLENERRVPLSSLQQLGEKFGIRVYETSAKYKTNVEETFMYLAKQIFEKKKNSKHHGSKTQSSSSRESCCLLM